MLTDAIFSILTAAEENGWVLEPDAKRILDLAGIPVPNFFVATTMGDAIQAARKIDYPVVAKAVSPAVIHKTDVDGVAVGVKSDDEIRAVFDRFRCLEQFQGMLVEEMVAGAELIVGAKIDYQFGPVVLLGIGGIGVELYGDTAVRMAPVNEQDVASMVHQLKGRRIVEGFRGSKPVDMKSLKNLVVCFSELIMDLEPKISSIDLNPVMCTSKGCIVADARIMLSDNTTVRQTNFTGAGIDPEEF